MLSRIIGRSAVILGLGAGVLAAGIASSQTVSVATTNLSRTPNDPDRNFDFLPWYISRADCETPGGKYVFQVDITNPTQELQVWASEGADCTLVKERSNGGNCWKLAGQQAAIVVTTQLLFSNIIAQMKPGTLAEPFTCDTLQKTPGNKPLSFYFMLLNNDTSEVIGTPAIMMDGGQTNLRVGYSLVPPSPPSQFAATPTPSGIDAQWSNVPFLINRAGFDIYCDALDPDEGDDDDPCGSPHLTPGEIPDPAYLCASREGSSNTGLTVTHGHDFSPLDPNTRYAFAVASFDDVLNTGVIGDVACATPLEPLPADLDSSCTVATVDTRNNTGAFGALLALGAALLTRRTRRAATQRRR